MKPYMTSYMILTMISPKISWLVPPLIGHVRWHTIWQSYGFNVSIPSGTGELGRGEDAEERSLGEVRSGLKSWSLGVRLAEFARGGEKGGLAEARSEAWQRGESDWSLEVLDGVCPTGTFIFLTSLLRRHMRSGWSGIVADPVWSILSPVLSVFSPARYAMKLC